MTTLTEADRKLAAGFAGPLETAHGITRIGMCKVSGRHLAEAANSDLHAIKVLWMAVGAAFQNQHPACAECGYIATFEGAPGERLCECSLGSRPYDKPSDCPAINQEVVL